MADIVSARVVLLAGVERGSACGRAVAFESEGALVPEDGDFPVDVFVHKRVNACSWRDKVHSTVAALTGVSLVRAASATSALRAEPVARPGRGTTTQSGPNTLRTVSAVSTSINYNSRTTMPRILPTAANASAPHVPVLALAVACTVQEL
jgi:hypothetical protein